MRGDKVFDRRGMRFGFGHGGERDHNGSCLGQGDLIAPVFLCQSQVFCGLAGHQIHLMGGEMPQVAGGPAGP